MEVTQAPHPILADDEVHYAGQPVAAVVAETRALAEDIAELVEVDWEPLDAVVDPRTPRRSCSASTRLPATSTAPSRRPRTSSVELPQSPAW